MKKQPNIRNKRSPANKGRFKMWRKMQNQLRAKFNPAEIEPDTAKAIVAFDEGLKRYSYGPPLRSSQELLTLIECDLVSLSLARDPDIELVEGGWHFAYGDAETEVSAMIDAVLPAPSLEEISDPLIVQLRSENLLQSKYPSSGGNTQPDGQIIGADGKITEGICLLGRLALGSVIAVDSVHDCFGASSDRWANGVFRRRKLLH